MYTSTLSSGLISCIKVIAVTFPILFSFQDRPGPNISSDNLFNSNNKSIIQLSQPALSTDLTENDFVISDKLTQQRGGNTQTKSGASAPFTLVPDWKFINPTAGQPNYYLNPSSMGDVNGDGFNDFIIVAGGGFIDPEPIYSGYRLCILRNFFWSAGHAQTNQIAIALFVYLSNLACYISRVGIFPLLFSSTNF